MNIRLLLVIITLKVSFSKSDTATSACPTPNVRTVLFKPSDLTKECWSQEEASLLYARRLMQELLPMKVPSDMNLLVNYIKLCLKVLQEEVTSKYTHQLLLFAMSDALGGYLQAYGFPLCKAKYYEGTTSYCVTKQMNVLLVTTKQILGTDGGSWTRQIHVEKSDKIAPFELKECGNVDSCRYLITNYDVLKHGETEKPKVHVPMPFIDSASFPSAVAVPFRNRSLFSLMSSDATDILVRYFMVAEQCLAGPCPNGERKNNPSIREFELDYHNWLTRVVVPHLNDERWYPGFGSVLRLVSTMSHKGVKTMPGLTGSFVAISEDERDFINKPTSPWLYILIVMALVLIFWLCFAFISSFSSFIKKRRCAKDGSTCSSLDSSGQVVNTLITMCEGPNPKVPAKSFYAPQKPIPKTAQVWRRQMMGDRTRFVGDRSRGGGDRNRDGGEHYDLHRSGREDYYGGSRR
ncbi:hypothetical protein O3M35_008251 [Rhynocoris fuscipes]|uniref:Uncharacterized protein n=1 Tax=Rhynocoris fuscipes TaxID=488301 RepID=A0AAW1DCM8_9HEMI